MLQGARMLQKSALHTDLATLWGPSVLHFVVLVWLRRGRSSRLRLASGGRQGGGQLGRRLFHHLAKKTGRNRGREHRAIALALDAQALEEGLHIRIRSLGGDGGFGSVKKAKKPRHFVGEALRVIFEIGRAHV